MHEAGKTQVENRRTPENVDQMRQLFVDLATHMRALAGQSSLDPRLDSTQLFEHLTIKLAQKYMPEEPENTPPLKSSVCIKLPTAVRVYSTNSQGVLDFVKKTLGAVETPAPVVRRYSGDLKFINSELDKKIEVQNISKSY